MERQPTRRTRRRRAEIARIAQRQWGHVTRAQLMATGTAGSAIDAWVRDGYLVRAHRGVYAVGYRRVEPEARAMAAVLAAGPGAVLSHASALALWGLGRWPAVPEVIAPGCVRRGGIRAHRSATLTRAEVTVQRGVPVTRAARAIRDVSPRLPERRRIRLANQARLERVITGAEAAALLGHHRNPTRSGGEDELQRWFTAYDIPQPLINVIVRGREVDAHWPRERVILQLDHLATHSDPLTFREDRRGDRENREAGMETVRLTVEDLTAAEATRLIRLLAARRAAPPPPGPAGC